MKSANLIAAIKYLGFTPKIDDWSWRFWIQKIAFILKVLDFGIDFEFIKKPHGPWSPELNKEYSLDYRHAFEHRQTSYVLSSNDIWKIEKMRESVPLLSYERLEGSASVLFLINKKNDWDEYVIVNQVREWKPTFPTETLTLSINDAKKILFNKEHLNTGIAEETAEWETLGLESVVNAE